MISGKPLCVAVFLCLSTAARAGDEVTGPGALGAGGTALANPDDDSAISQNSATIGLIKRYDLQAHGTYGPDGGWDFGGSVVDSREGPIALGIEFRHSRSEPALTDAELPGWVVKGETIPNKKRYEDFVLGFGVPFDHRHASFGFGGFLSFFDNDREGKGQEGNLNLSMAFAPLQADEISGTPKLVLALSGRNLLPLAAENPVQLLAGGRYRADKVGSLALDVGFQPAAAHPTILRFGAEALVKGELGIRAGFRYEGPTDLTAVTWGIGFENSSGDIEYGVEIPVGTPFKLGGLVQQLGIRLKT